MQKKYTPEKLNVVLLSVDQSRELYDSRAAGLFKKYGGAEWPSVILDDGFESARLFGDFGYGKVVVDEKGIVRSINQYDLEHTLEKLLAQ